MPEVRPPEHLVEQQRQRERLLTQPGVRFPRQEEAGAPRSAAGLHRLQEHLQLLLLDLLQDRVRQRLQFGLGAGVRLTGARFPEAAARGAAGVGVSVALRGRTAPPESPDEPRSFGPEHAGRQEGSPATKRPFCPQVMKIRRSESTGAEQTAEKRRAGEADAIRFIRQTLIFHLTESKREKLKRLSGFAGHDLGSDVSAQSSEPIRERRVRS